MKTDETDEGEDVCVGKKYENRREDDWRETTVVLLYEHQKGSVVREKMVRVKSRVVKSKCFTHMLLH